MPIRILREINMKRKNKLPFSLTRSGGFYKIRSNKNQEIVSGPISNEKHKAVKVLLNYANTDRFGNFYHGRDTLRNLLKVFNGRLRPKGTAWTLEEARLIAKTIKTRKQLHDSGLFDVAQSRGWLEEISSDLPPSQRKYTRGVVDPTKVLAEVFNYDTYSEIRALAQFENGRVTQSILKRTEKPSLLWRKQLFRLFH